jgi:hypothetical protein
MNQNILKESENLLSKIVSENEDPFGLVDHVREVVRWSSRLIKKFPEADEEITLLGAWLHDVGHYPITQEDHAITGEKRAKEFLEENNYPQDKMSKVLHCVRSHRCKDVMPETIEARIVAFSDSASHLTGSLYLDMLRKGMLEVMDKLERDFRDLDIFPDIKKELEPLYESWKKLLREMIGVGEA